jgi:hypothetical protein
LLHENHTSYFDIFIIIVVFTGTNLNAQPDAKGDHRSILGSWVLLSKKLDGKVATTDIASSKEPRRGCMLITDAHVLFGGIDVTTRKLSKITHGGSYTFTGDRFVETLEFGTPPQTYKHTVWVEGDRLYKVGSIGKNKMMMEEVWVRFTSAELDHLSQSKQPSTIGQQLIDLKSARDSGAITEAEYQTQKAKVLGK